MAVVVRVWHPLKGVGLDALCSQLRLPRRIAVSPTIEEVHVRPFIFVVLTLAGVSPATKSSAATPRVFPLPAKVVASYAHVHHDYPATDIFAKCGSSALTPIDGRVLEVTRVDRWNARVDDPDTRGGRSVSILGDDGVRYYLSHFRSVPAGIDPGVRVKAGDVVGEVGKSGNAVKAGCHIHFGLSPNCPTHEWQVRRGVLYPWPYLDSWRAGGDRSPAAAITAWSQAHPNACSEAVAALAGASPAPSVSDS